MTPIRSDTVYTKTAKGLLELTNKLVRLPPGLGVVFVSVDGKANVAELVAQSGLDPDEVHRALERLARDGYIEDAVMRGQHANAHDEEDLDFTPAPATPMQPADLGPSAEPDLDTAERVQELNARLKAERQAREQAGRDARQVHSLADEPPEIVEPGALRTSESGVSAAGEERAGASRSELDDDRASAAPEYVPTALERAMARLARNRGQGQAGGTTAPARSSGKTPAPSAALARGTPGPQLLEPRPAAESPSPGLFAEAEAHRRAEAEQLGRDAERAHRQRAKDDVRRKSRLARDTRRSRLRRGIALALIGTPLVAVALLQYLPLNGYVPAAEQALSERLGEPVAISAVRYVLLPTSRLMLENVRLAKRPGLHVERIETRLPPWTALRGIRHLELVEVYGLQLDPAIVAALPASTSARASGAPQVDRVRLHGAKLNLPQVDLGEFDGEVTFDVNGAVNHAVLDGSNAKLELTPAQPPGVRFRLKARDWRIPYGPALEFSDLVATGLIDGRQSASADVTGRLGGGAVEGALNASWGSAVTVGGKFKVQQARIDELVTGFASSFSARGILQANGRFVMKAADWPGLQPSARVDATFSLVRGELVNVDLLQAMQSRSTAALRGGKTPFDTLSGVLQAAQGHYTYRDLQLTSGPLKATGSVSVAPDGRLNGRVNAELGSRGSLLVRSAFVLAGTLQDPQLKR